MNSDSPKMPREEMETWLTSLLLGELSAGEAAAVRELIKHDPQLARLHDELKSTIQLVREVTVKATEASPAVEDQPKLSAERREKLLAQFKTVAPKEFVPEKRRSGLRLLELAAVLAILAIVAAIALPSLKSFNSPRGYATKSASAPEEARLAADTALESAQANLLAERLQSDYSTVTLGGREMNTSFSYDGDRDKSGENLSFYAKSEQFGPAKKPVGLTPLSASPPTQIVLPAAQIERNYTVTAGENRAVSYGSIQVSEQPVTEWSASLAGQATAAATPPATVSQNSATTDSASLIDPSTGLPANAEPALVVDPATGLPVAATATGDTVDHLKAGEVALGQESLQRNSESLGEAFRRRYTPAQTASVIPRVSVAGGGGGGGGGAGAGQIEPHSVPPAVTQSAPNNTSLSRSDAAGIRLKEDEGKSGFFGGAVPTRGATADGADEFRASNRARTPAETPPEVRLYARFSETDPKETLARGLDSPAGKPPVAGLVLGRTFTNSAAVNDQWGDNSQQDGQQNVRLTGTSPARPTRTAKPGSAPQPLMESESLARYEASIPELEQRYAEERGRLEQLKSLDQPQSRRKLSEVSDETTLGFKVAEEKLATLQKDSAAKVSELQLAQNQIGDLKKRADDRNGRGLARSGTQATTTLNGSLATGKAIEGRKSGADRFGNVLEDLPVRRPATNAPIPQPEIATSENNFSTFSLNVSDVSFKLAAASLEQGQMPDVASVRTEEFINAFDYRDPEPLPGAPIAFAWERARYPFAHSRDLLRFSLKTAAAGRQAGRPLNVVLLLDNSGSMERADRVRIIREALSVLAGQLQPQDKLSVITFARTPRLFADGAPGSDAGAIARALTELTPEGGTNLEEAMNLAYQTAAKHYLANGINRVVLLTDGAANLGDVEPESLKQKVEAARVQGIALDCFGIGWDGLNDDLLEVLSRNGDGRYGFINSPEEAATEFVGQLAGALKVAASDVKVQVEFNPRRVTTYRQIGYAKHQLTKEQFRDNTVDAAEIAAQETGNALYTVEVNPAASGPLCTVRVRYKIPGTTNYREQAWDVPYTGNVHLLEQSSPAMRLAASAAAFSEWLVASPFAGDVSPDAVLNVLRGVPEVFGADSRPKTLEWMIRQAKSIEGK